MSTSARTEPSRPVSPLDDASAPFYTIGQVASLLGVRPAAIRRFEQERLIAPIRSQGGQRRYSRDEVDRLREVVDLAEEGVTLAGVRRVLALRERVDELEAAAGPDRAADAGPRAGARPDGTVEGVPSAVPSLADQRNDDSFPDIWEEIVWRGLVHVSTDPAELKALLADGPITYYCGFDPTAPSLHLGNLVQLLLLRRLQLAGHRPIGLVGGSTGLIGDPRPTAERTLHSRETVAEWVARLEAQVRRFLSFEGENAARIVNNLDWFGRYSAIDFLRDIGKHFRVGTMLKKDAVAARLSSDAGISYTEFSYQILQGDDFLQLYRNYGCILQTGGSDQWGNLTSGIDLIHKVEGVTAHAIGTPLITNSDGTKFGKSEGNAIWLDPEMCSPYRFYQFWLNQADADVIDRLKVFTFLPRAEIERLEAAVAAEPFKREAQRTLAWEVTSLVHGEEAARAAIAASEALFGQGDLAALDEATLRSAVEELETARLPAGAPVVAALAETGLVSSLSEGRRAIQQGGIYVDNAKVVDENAVLEPALAGGIVVLRRGKRSLAAAFTR